MNGWSIHPLARDGCRRQKSCENSPCEATTGNRSANSTKGLFLKTSRNPLNGTRTWSCCRCSRRHRLLPKPVTRLPSLNRSRSRWREWLRNCAEWQESTAAGSWCAPRGPGWLQSSLKRKLRIQQPKSAALPRQHVAFFAQTPPLFAKLCRLLGSLPRTVLSRTARKAKSHASQIAPYLRTLLGT